VVWEFSYQPRPSPTGTSVVDALGPSLSRFDAITKEAIGVFGSLDAPMPGVGYLLWLMLLAALTATALAVGHPRDRASIIGLLAGTVVVTLIMSVVYREVSVLQGRYVLPFLVLLPLWVGEVLLRRRARLPGEVRRFLVGAAFFVAAAVHVLGWWASGRRFAVGEGGSWLYFFDSKWAPPLGWLPWLGVVAAAGAAYAVAAGVSTGAIRAAHPTGKS
jgi:Predicted membrane protein (DUF2142)